MGPFPFLVAFISTFQAINAIPPVRSAPCNTIGLLIRDDLLSDVPIWGLLGGRVEMFPYLLAQFMVGNITEIKRRLGNDLEDFPGPRDFRSCATGNAAALMRLYW
jgi:hypothetical protein